MENNSIDVNCMTKTYANFAKCYGPKKGQTSGTGFADMVLGKLEETHVLSAIRANFSFRDPYQSWNYSVLHFGASDEESYGQSFGGGSRVINEKEETYWERRQKRRKKRQEELLEIQEKKAIAKRFAQEKYDTKLAQIKVNPGLEGMELQSPDAVAAYEASLFAELIMRNHFEV